MLASSQSCALRPSLRSARRAFQPGCRPVHARPVVRTQAYVEVSTSFAVVQQALAFSVVLGAEAAYTRSQLPEGAPGRPDVIPVAAAAGVTAVAAGLAALNNEALYTPAFIAGLLASAAMMAYNTKRIIDTKQDDTDWPGPKAWPATMTLISFFALNVFFQAIRAEI